MLRIKGDTAHEGRCLGTAEFRKTEIQMLAGRRDISAQDAAAIYELRQWLAQNVPSQRGQVTAEGIESHFEMDGLQYDVVSFELGRGRVHQHRYLAAVGGFLDEFDIDGYGGLVVLCDFADYDDESAIEWAKAAVSGYHSSVFTVRASA